MSDEKNAPEAKKSLPIFNPAVPSIIMIVVAAIIGAFCANLSNFFDFL
ncbi:MAG: hypothetical protein LBT26_06010 [Clostridiales Family XIII bacterium]|jgi:hypothetical protein|nr:hypothetical protein [Clostridiales Family XIII bacterium]